MWPLVDLELFYDKVKLGFCMGKGQNCVDLCEAIVACDIQSWYMQSPR